ncbi:3-deoxy-manno-octulosonate cytidylyltransferase [Phycisphaerae bacterium RAS1]|nr:3-deoxy-manno-octulosonate cytidylyltransferase [Phycisphaerae bacterium RAS1]
MQVLAVIPARYGSSRYPGKPLLRQTGKFLIQHVYERAQAAARVDRVLVATDDERIRAAVESFGGMAVMTRADHPSGTDRIAEVARKHDGPPDQIILNVQGDEPEIDPAHLDRLVDRMEADALAPIATLACPFAADGDPRDPNSVKVVCNRAGRALYFSRSLLPYPRDAGGQVADPAGWLLHLGVYAYRRSFLLEMAGWRPTTLEQTEKLEQLRVLEHGHAIAVEIVERAAVGIDTPADYERFLERYSVSQRTN